MAGCADAGCRTFRRLLGLADILDGSIRRIGAHEQQRPIMFGRADPSVLCPVEFDLFIAGELRQIQTWGNGTQGKTIRFCNVVDIVRSNHRPRAGHVLDDDFWISLDMFSEVSCIGTSPQIMGIAGEITDRDPDRFALEKGGLGCGVCRAQKYCQESQYRLLHTILLRFITKLHWVRQ